MKATTYYNLTFSGTGAKTMNGGTVVNGTLNITVGAAQANIGAGLTIPVRDLALGGTLQIHGTWGSTSSTATNQNNTYFAATTGMLLALGGVPPTATGTYTISYVGNYVIYQFTGSGSFTPGMDVIADVLVVGGGGGGGGIGSTGGVGLYQDGGGGGAGGFVSQTGISLTGGNAYTVTVGNSGTAGTSTAKGGNGGNSVFGSYTATGGGGGGSAMGTDSTADGGTGGSGGGGGYEYGDGYAGKGGPGTTLQGNNGAAGNSSSDIGGGGGGAGAAGSGKNGGNGTASSITGTSLTYAGGGGAGYSGTAGTGGGGTGGNGGAGTPGTANTGGGGGGADGYNVTSGGAGGSGVVIVRYQWATYPTAVRFHGFSAVPQDGGVLLRWRSGHEVDNLGFHVYRDGVRLTPSLVAGSALLAGRTALTAGNSYTWFDPEGTASSTYTIEDVDLSGVRAVNGPFGVDPTAAAPGRPSRAAGRRPTQADAADAATRSRTIGELGRPGSGAGRWFRTSAGDVAAGDVVAGDVAPPPPAANAQPGQPSTLFAGQALGVATTQATASQTRQQYTLASGPAVKLGVQQEGWYHVDAGQLTAAGMPAYVTPSTLQLFVNGQEQDLLVAQQGGQVAAIEFYGTGVDTTWSDTQVYWLTWGAQVGQRIQASNAKANSAAPTSFPFTVQWTPRQLYFAALNNGDANNFFGPVLTSSSEVTQTLPVTNVSAGTPGPSTLWVRMQGVTDGTHVVQVMLNGIGLGSLVFEDQESGVASFAVVDTASLAAGATLTLTTLGSGDVTLVDTVTLTYPHRYAADGDVLRCTASAGQRVGITGFSTSTIRVMDITDPANVIAPQGTVARQPDGSYAVTVVAPSGGTRTLLAFTAGQMEAPASVEANQPSSWHAAQAGANLVIISHGDFLGSLAPLVALRQSQGLKVAVVNVEDLYDEFNFGGLSPYAVKTFLATANTAWKTKPRWVLLVGDATLDPRDYLGFHRVNYVPAELVATAQLKTVSDDWFVDFNLDGLPDLAIGRLPVQKVSDAAALVAKIVAYDGAGAAAWKNQALLVAGANDNENNFEAYTAAVQALLPARMSVTQILQGSDANAAADFLAAFNSGQGLVNFSGHGSVGGLAGRPVHFRHRQHADQRRGDAVCDFHDVPERVFPDVTTFSLAEAVLEAPGGGAVGVWASSGLTESAPQATLNQAMIKALYGGGSITVGEAAVAAKQAVTDPDVRRTWILFGDPAMKLR